MSVQTPPIPNVSTFNNDYWTSASNTALTIAGGDIRYLKYPVAQGSENLQNTIVNGTLNVTGTTNLITTAITGALNIGTSILGVATAYFGNFTIGSPSTALSQLTIYAQSWVFDNIYFYNTSGLKRTLFYVSTIAMDDTTNSGSSAVQASLARTGGLIISDNTQMTFRQSVTEKIKFTSTTSDFTNTTINLNTASGTINLGTGATSTTNTNIMTGATPSGTLTIGRPITTSYIPSDITGNTQIGYQISIIGTSLSALGTTLVKNGTLITLPAGVWIINATAVLGASSASTSTILSFSTSASVADTTRNQTFYPPSGIGGLDYNMNTTYSLTASSTIYMYGKVSINTQGTTSISGYATRIA